MDTGVQTMTDFAATQATAPHLRRTSSTSMAQIDKTADDFQSVFMGQMLQPMFEGLGVDPTFGGGHAEEVMRGLLVQEYGKVISKSGNFGIAAAVKAEMIRAQGGAAAIASKYKSVNGG